MKQKQIYIFIKYIFKNFFNKKRSVFSLNTELKKFSKKKKN